MSNIKRSWKEIYNEDPPDGIILTLLTIVMTTMIYLHIRLWPIVPKSTKFFNIFKERIADGYWLIFLAPFVLISWIIAAIIIALLFILVIAIDAIFVPFMCVGIVWAIFEVAGDFINKKHV